MRCPGFREGVKGGALRRPWAAKSPSLDRDDGRSSSAVSGCSCWVDAPTTSSRRPAPVSPRSLKYEAYHNLDGSLKQSKEPVVGGLPAESLDYGYDTLGNLTSIGGSTGYLLDVDYSAPAQPNLLTLGAGGTDSKNVYVANDYEVGTGVDEFVGIPDGHRSRFTTLLVSDGSDDGFVVCGSIRVHED